MHNGEEGRDAKETKITKGKMERKNGRQEIGQDGEKKSSKELGRREVSKT